MSTPFYDLASLVVVPSGYKASKVYAQKPLTTDGQLTFSRASTATRVNASGLIETVSSGVPRLDYTNSSCPKILLEPQRTNNALYSEQLDNAAWTKQNTTVTANAVTSPSGYQDADKLVETVSTGVHRASVSSGATLNGTFSFFAKAGERTKVAILSTTIDLGFDLSNGTLIDLGSGTSVGKIENYGNGWYRCSLPQASGIVALALALLDNAGNISYTGNGTSGAYFWGAQLEVGAYATSYIPTLGTSVTRVADAASKTGISSLIGQTEGTIFWEVDIKIPTATALEAIVNIDGGSFGNTFYIYQSASTFAAEVFVSSASQAYFTKGSITAGVYKCALAYANNNTAFFINGVQVGNTDTSCSVPATSRIQMGQTALSSDTSWTKQLLLFKTRLTNAQLAELTTL